MLDMLPGQQEHGSIHHPALERATPLISQHLPSSSGTPQSPGSSSESCAACETLAAGGPPDCVSGSRYARGLASQSSQRRCQTLHGRTPRGSRRGSATDQTDRRGPLEIKFGTRFSGSVPRFLAYTEQSLPTGFLTRIPCLHGTILAYRFPNSERSHPPRIAASEASCVRAACAPRARRVRIGVAAKEFLGTGRPSPLLDTPP